MTICAIFAKLSQVCAELVMRFTKKNLTQDKNSQLTFFVSIKSFPGFHANMIN